MEENKRLISEILELIKGKQAHNSLSAFLKSEDAKYLLSSDLYRLRDGIYQGGIVGNNEIKQFREAASDNRSQINDKSNNLTERDLMDIPESSLEGFNTRTGRLNINFPNQEQSLNEVTTPQGVGGLKETDRATRARSEAISEDFIEESNRVNNGTSSSNRSDSSPVDSASERSPFSSFETELAELQESLSGLGVNIDQSKYPVPSADSSNSEFLQKREKINNFINDFRESLGPVIGIIDHIRASREEKEAGRLVDRSIRQAPATPGVRGQNRAISGLIRESRLANRNPSQFVQPYIDQANLGYQQDLAESRNLSGGQAGTQVGLSQGASMRRNLASRQAGLMSADAYNQGLERTAGLVEMQARDDADRDDLTQQQFRYLNEANRQDQIAAGQALASARARKAQTRNNLLSTMLNSPVFDIDTYSGFIRNNLRNNQ